ncbi:MAG TPA: hypothetical protein VNL91_04170 [Thermoanaerobaculia bacterium]|nr:hypothetical protein [Thermoanaerobaculia bacterium]
MFELRIFSICSGTSPNFATTRSTAVSTSLCRAAVSALAAETDFMSADAPCPNVLNFSAAFFASSPMLATDRFAATICASEIRNAF